MKTGEVIHFDLYDIGSTLRETFCGQRLGCWVSSNKWEEVTCEECKSTRYKMETE